RPRSRGGAGAATGRVISAAGGCIIGLSLRRGRTAMIRSAAFLLGSWLVVAVGCKSGASLTLDAGAPGGDGASDDTVGASRGGRGGAISGGGTDGGGAGGGGVGGGADAAAGSDGSGDTG